MEQITNIKNVFSVDSLCEFITTIYILQTDEVCVFFPLHLSFFVPLQWSVGGVFPVFAHFATAAEPQPGHHER